MKRGYCIHLCVCLEFHLPKSSNSVHYLHWQATKHTDEDPLGNYHYPIPEFESNLLTVKRKQISKRYSN